MERGLLCNRSPLCPRDIVKWEILVGFSEAYKRLGSEKSTKELKKPTKRRIRSLKNVHKYRKS